MRAPRPAMRSGWRAAAHAAIALSSLFGLQAHAEEEVSFRGKTVRMLVGSVPGGVTDVGARTIARFVGKYLPQSPTVVVQNMPAANGIAAVNLFYAPSRIGWTNVPGRIELSGDA